MRTNTLGWIWMLALALGGCSMDAGTAVEPSLTGRGKADVGDTVTSRGALRFDEGLAEHADELTSELEFHGVSFHADAGAVVDVEITQRGTSRGLDTTLFVFALNEGGYERIGFDDDDGWGPYSRIEGLALPVAEEIFVVVGTKYGDGLGRYRLEVRCGGDACAAPAPAECPVEVQHRVEDCVGEIVADQVYDRQEADYRGALVSCFLDEPTVAFERACRWDPSSWCDGDFDAAIDTCRAIFEERYPEPPSALRVRRRTLAPALRERVDRFYSDYASADAAGYELLEGETDVTAERLLRTFRGEWDAPFEGGGERSIGAFAGVAESHDFGSDFVELLRADAGTDELLVAHASASWYPAAAAQAWADLWVVHASTGLVYVFFFEAGEP